MEENKVTKNPGSFMKFDGIGKTLPAFLEVRGQNWISFGQDNLWPDLIIELFNQSAVNRTCIVSKLDAAVGEGLRTVDPNQEWVLKEANRRGETWNEIWEKVAQDYILHGGFALNVIWGKTGEFIAEVYHVDFSKIRSGHMNPETDRVEEYYFCPDWRKHRKHKPKAYKAFDKDFAIDFPSQIYYAYDYAPGNAVYPLSDWVGGVNDCLTDIQTSIFHNSNLQNGLVPSLWINMNNGIPDPQEQQQIYNTIADTFSGSGNAGKFFLSFADDPATAPTVTPLQASNDGYYLALDQRVTSRILTAHRITSPLLLGIRDGGSGLGNNKDEIVVAYAHFMQTVIKPITKFLLKNFSFILREKGYEDIELYVEPNKLFAEDISGNPTDVATPEQITVEEGDI